MVSIKKLRFRQGFFYNANDRGVQGLNWRKNVMLDLRTRECKDSIGIPGSKIIRILAYEKLVVEMYYTGRGGEIFLGTFSMPTKAMENWMRVNGLYLTSNGKTMLAIPLSLWRIEKEMEENINQLRLFQTQ